MAAKSYDKYLKKKKFPNPKHRKFEGVAEKISSDRENTEFGGEYRVVHKQGSKPGQGGYIVVATRTQEQVLPSANQPLYQTPEQAKEAWRKLKQKRKNMSNIKNKNLRMRRKAVEDENQDDFPDEGNVGIEGMDDMPGDGQFEEGDMDELSEEGDELGEDMDMGGGDEKYSAQVMRRLHQDGLILMEEYDEMSGMLENEEVGSLLQRHLEALEEFLEELEEVFKKHHGDLPALEGALEKEDLEEVEKYEKDEADDPNALEADADDEREEEEPSAEEAFEGTMGKVAEDKEKSKPKPKEKSLARTGRSKAYQDYLRWKAAKALKGGNFPSLKQRGTGKLTFGKTPLWKKGKKAMERCPECKCAPCKCVSSKKKDFSTGGDTNNEFNMEVPPNGQKPMGAPNGVPQARQSSLDGHKRSPVRNNHVKHIEEVKEFLGEISTKEFSDETMRSKAFHYSKTLFDLAHEGITDFGKSLDETTTDLHPDRVKCLQLSKFLEEVSRIKDFGDRHRETAKHWYKDEIGRKKEDIDNPDLKKKKEDKKSQPDKEVKQLLETSEQQTKAMEELSKKLSSLTEHLNGNT